MSLLMQVMSWMHCSYYMKVWRSADQEITSEWEDDCQNVWASTGDPSGFRAAYFDFVALGCYRGFRQQEFAMDTKKHTKYYVFSDGTTVVHAFTVKNFIFFDEDMTLLQERDVMEKFGTKYGVQNTCMNDQIIVYAKVVLHP